MSDRPALYKPMNFCDQQKLLGHPLCMALVRHKWRSFGRYQFHANLALYVLFLASLTLLVLSVPAPYSQAQIMDYSTIPING